MKEIKRRIKLRKHFNLMILVVIEGSFLMGCEFFALSFAPKKESLINNFELTNHAHKVFCETPT